MKQKIELLPLFDKFIAESKNGKRRKINGEKLKKGSIRNYEQARKLLHKYIIGNEYEWRVCEVHKLTKREFISEKRYWKSFYNNFTNYMYRNGCYDNYVGSTIKHIRTFFNYLKKEKNIQVGEFHKEFYVRKHDISIKVLSIDRLKYLIHNKSMDHSLTKHQIKIKDVFLFGCTTGLRYSDIITLTNKHFEKIDNEWYIKVKTRKTKAYTIIKLPTYAVEIYFKYKSRRNTSKLFNFVCLDNFNFHLKLLGECFGWVELVDYTREKLGNSYKIKKNYRTQTRFCDIMSSHMMRRTAITTMLILGMPEHLVRNVSGHTNGSSSFFKYVHYAQSYLNEEITKVHNQLNRY